MSAGQKTHPNDRVMPGKFVLKPHNRARRLPRNPNAILAWFPVCIPGEMEATSSEIRMKKKERSCPEGAAGI